MYRVPPWIIKGEGLVEEFLMKNMEERKHVLENVMLSNTRDIEMEDNICADIYYIKALLKMYGER